LDRFIHRQDKDFAVADRALAAGSAKLQQALDRAIDKVVVNGDLEFHFAEQIGGVFVAAIGFGLAPLPRKSHGIANGEAGHPDPFERLLHQIELGGLDDSDDELHGNSITGRNALAYSILRPAISAKCIVMKIISRQPCDNLQEILANWFTPTEMRDLLAEEIAGGLSGARFWRVTVGERTYCLRRAPIKQSRSISNLMRIHAFLEYLWKEGFHEIARPCRTLNQQTVIETFDAVWELSNFLPGEATKNPTLLQAVAASEFLARLHLVAASYQNYPLRIAPGLKHRLEMCEELRNGKLDEIDAAIEHSTISSERDMALKIASQLRSVLPKVIDHLESAYQRVPVQWCLVDCHIGNFLFTGDQVTGLVDFATAGMDSVTRDVARLVGSLVTHDQSIWKTCLASYQALRPLSRAELQLILAYHTSGLVGRAGNWLEWRFMTRADFADAATTHARLGELSVQLAAIDETAAIIAAFSRGLA
jgi:Ser/Thr protein kinase RdoA (MazF antagonist)